LLAKLESVGVVVRGSVWHLVAVVSGGSKLEAVPKLSASVALALESSSVAFVVLARL
jgi:hypothetical protein